MNRLFFFFLFTPVLLCLFSTSYAIEKKIVYGGLVDLQYSFDFNAPKNGDRAFTTQPARHNELNVNLAFLDLTYQTEKIRSRLALQAGTSVQANYATEPTNGTVSGDELSRHIQEARIGYHLSDKTWIDAGIFFSHLGAEGWISKDNLTLSRSLVADYSPYYLSGIKITHSCSDRLKLLFLIVNGWQNISENNNDKNIGTGIEYTFDSLSFTYNTMIGNEISPDLNGLSRSSRFRHFHDLLIKSRGLENWEWVAQYDFGFQKSEDEQSTHSWQGALLMLRYKLNALQKISTRFEYFEDPQQVLIITNRPFSFKATGASLGFDSEIDEAALWRLEVRYIKANNPVYPQQLNEFVDSNLTLTTSLSLSF